MRGVESCCEGFGLCVHVWHIHYSSLSVHSKEAVMEPHPDQ